jgi:1,4-dihydroxy-2-naphthoate octaprenyltransferase
MTKTYLKALRLPFLVGSLIPLITASALVFKRGSFSLLPFAMALIGLGALHLGSAQALTIQTVVSMGLLISGALFMSRIIGR